MNQSGPRRLVPFDYGFRPFFLAALVWAFVAVPAWMLVRASGVAPLPELPAQLWHGHEMLFGFVVAAIAGFLLTSVPSWTGRRGFAGAPLVLLSSAWLAGRLALLFAAHLPPALVAGAELLFLPGLCALIAPPLLRENNRNTPLLLVLLALWIIDGTFLLGAARGDAALASTALRVALDLMLVVVTVVGGRIVPLTTTSVLRQSGVARPARRHPVIDAATIAAMALMAGVDAAAPFIDAVAPRLAALASGSRDLRDVLPAAAAGVAALLQAVRIAGWRGLHAGADPEVAPLQLASLWLVVGLAMKALHLATGATWATEWLHALTVGTIAMLIVAVVVRTSHAYTGRPLRPGRVIIAAFVVLAVAALVRVFAIPGLARRELLLWLATGLWTVAFAVALRVQGAVLLRPRVDRRAG